MLRPKQNRSVFITGASCLLGWGLAAIEMGLFTSHTEVAEIKIGAVDTEARILARMQMQDGRFVYKSSRLDRTAGKLAQGQLFVPA